MEPKADPATKSQPQPSRDPKTKPVPDPISVSSSSDWDTLITLLAIFRGVFWVEQGVVGDVLVVGGTYEGSFSASVSSSISLKVWGKGFRTAPLNVVYFLLGRHRTCEGIVSPNKI